MKDILQSKTHCLTDEDLYAFISGQGRAEKLSRAEAHFAECSSCRQNLAALMQILHPESPEVHEFPDLPEADLQQALSVIQAVSRRERPARTPVPRWISWSAAAVAAAAFLVFCFAGILRLRDRSKSEAFFAQAKTVLEETYTGTSPGNLRLALPFDTAAGSRSEPRTDSLRTAENLFFQALAVREDMVEAHLGLGFIYLRELQFPKARSEFQKILDMRGEQSQALLGRGVTEYEEALQDSVPLGRNRLLNKAVDDFDAVLKRDPGSVEARYDKIWALFESGRHPEALQEIELYLSRDPGSVWAMGVKGLRVKIRATQSSVLRDEIDRAAHARDRAALFELSRQAPHQMPSAIWSTMQQSSGVGDRAASASPEDLRWAAGILEAGYSASTGDHSFKGLIGFYEGLSPPQREMKKALDRQFQDAILLHRQGQHGLALQSSKSLQPQYAKLRDFWQLMDLHHLRGNSLYLGKADFRGAETEYQQIYAIADRLNSVAEKVLALQALAKIYGAQREFEKSISAAARVRDLARKSHVDAWQASACVMLGNQYGSLGRYEQALGEYSAALSLAYPLLDGLKITEALENSGAAMDRLGRTGEAEAYCRLAMEQLDRFLKEGLLRPIPEVTTRRLNLLNKWGDLALRNGDLRKAESLFDECLRSVPSGMRELEGRNRIGLAEVYLQSKRFREAEVTLAPALGLSPSGEYPEIEWKADFVRGRLFEETGKTDEAFSSFRKSISILQRMRRQIQPGDMRESFLTDRYDPYKSLVGLLYRSQGDRQMLVEFVDEAKSATLKENLDRRTLGQGRKSRERALAFLEYFFTRDKLLILATAEGSVQAAERNVSREEIGSRVLRLLQCARSNSAGFAELARNLYSELIAPVEDYLFARNPGTIVILPDGPLYLLPFAGLQDASGRFLIERAPLAFASSRSVFRRCLVSDSEGAAGQLLLIDGSAGLPHARNELAYISNLYGSSSLVVTAGQMSSLPALIGQSSVLHFSGHAVLRQGEPVLMLQQSPREVYLDRRTIRNWTMPESKLVNLAGCNTAIGTVAEGEAPWGLIPAFLDAGAHAVIASLMEVDDASTERISCRFYDLVRSGHSKAQALQLAQLDLLNWSRTAAAAKPESWIPYILVGNPQ